MALPRIAHIVNPFHAKAGGDLFLAQPITFESMREAKARTPNNADIELWCACFAEDVNMAPEGFRATQVLTRSVNQFHAFKQPLKLPLLADILERLYNESNADYLVYTNVDIGLYPDFYVKVQEFISRGHDAFIINRRRLENKYSSVEQLPQIYTDTGKKHPGFDCFVFQRSLFPQMKLEGICLGVPFIEIAFSQNLFALAKNFALFDNEILTFHIGMEVFKKRAPREYFWHHRRQYHRIEKLLLPRMSLKKFPYARQNFISRYVKWALHPCIPLRLVVLLMFRGLRS